MTDKDLILRFKIFDLANAMDDASKKEDWQLVLTMLKRGEELVVARLLEVEWEKENVV